MKSPNSQDLIDKALRGRLTTEERTQWDLLLAREPSVRAAFEHEAALDQLLGHLPDLPVSNNFASRVTQAALIEARAARPGPGFGLWRLRPLFGRAAAVTAGLVALGLVIGVQYQRRQAAMEAGVRSFTGVALAMSADEAPPEEVFQNFEAIQRLSFPAESELDLELLVALQK